MTTTNLRYLIIALFIALALLCVSWEAWLAPVRPGAWILSIKALPLLLALPGLFAGRRRTYQWWSMFSLAYMTEGLVRATSESGISQQLAIVEIVLATLLFVAVLLYCRVDGQVVR